MKRITILNLILLACMMATAQTNYGLKSGISASYFNNFTMHQSPGFVGGVYAKQDIYKKHKGELQVNDLHNYITKLYTGYIGFTKLNDSVIVICREENGEHKFEHESLKTNYIKLLRKTRFSIQEELIYVSKGGYNNNEETNFKTHYIQANVLAGVRVGFLTFQAGGYAARLVRTENYTWFGPSNDWPFRDWIYRKYDAGLVGGLEIDLHGAILSGQYQHGFRNVINKESKWHSMNGFRQRSLVVQLQIPFKL